MSKIISGSITWVVERLVRYVILPVTSVIPALASSGILLVLFAGLWLAFATAVATDPGALDGCWRSLGALALPVQGVVWLLLMPLAAGLWVWSTSWPLAVRLVLIAGIAGWNLLVFIPRRDGAAAEPASDVATPAGDRRHAA